jgi:hypothetical protein
MTGPLEFSCYDCGDFACYGVGVSLRNGQPGKWFCAACHPTFQLPKPQPLQELSQAVRDSVATMTLEEV